MAEELEKKKAVPEKEGAVTDDEAETAAGGITRPTIEGFFGQKIDPIKLEDDNNR